MVNVWQNHAACAGDMTFGENTELAAATCAACPVRAECHAWAASEYRFTGFAAGAVWIDSRVRRRAAWGEGVRVRRGLREPKRTETTEAYRAAVAEWVEAG